MKTSNFKVIEPGSILSFQAMKKIMGGVSASNREVCRITCSDGTKLEKGCDGGECRSMGSSEIRCLSTVGARYTKFALTCTK